MAKMKGPKGKVVKGCDYAEEDEKFDRKQSKMALKRMKTAGLALKLKKSEAEEGYSKKPRVKPQKKTKKPISGQGKQY